MLRTTVLWLMSWRSGIRKAAAEEMMDTRGEKTTILMMLGKRDEEEIKRGIEITTVMRDQKTTAIARKKEIDHATSTAREMAKEMHLATDTTRSHRTEESAPSPAIEIMREETGIEIMTGETGIKITIAETEETKQTLGNGIAMMTRASLWVVGIETEMVIIGLRGGRRD
jgi:sRNA-binding protein